jgi:predicted ATPase
VRDFCSGAYTRRISFEESLHFERVHEETYRNFGFELVPIAPGSLLDRVDAIKRSASVEAKWFITV